MENAGIDPATSHMLSERSTIWANSPPLMDVLGSHDGSILVKPLFMQFPLAKSEMVDGCLWFEEQEGR